MAESNDPQIALTDAERFPLLQDLSFLNKLKQDEFAPKFNFKSGDRLDKKQLSLVDNYAEKYCKDKVYWAKDELPNWMENYIKWSIKEVPFYQNKASKFTDFPTISRNDIRNQPHLFVSNDANLEDLLVYYTSGSTGPKLDVLFNAVSQANWLPQIESILKDFNISFIRSKDITTIAMICAQEKTLTFASLSTYLHGAGILKINLNPAEWNEKQDAKKYLEKYNPQILTGDPLAFIALMELEPEISPDAMISSAMQLTAGTKKQLEDYFHCPVIDLYSLTECRNIAYATQNGFKAIRTDIYLEIFDEQKDIKINDGERGELVVTGGSNPFLPLIRYRTGDFCRLEIRDGVPFLLDLEARNPIVFYTNSDEKINNIDISNQLSKLALAGFKLNQKKDKSVEFLGYSNEVKLEDVAQILKGIFQNDVVLEITLEKITQNNNVAKTLYTSDYTSVI